VQLAAEGGTSSGSAPAYEWRTLSGAQNALSCTNCPNPVFSGEQTTAYTVRIWNNDSCSVVRPVKVIVNEPPTGSFSATDSKCSAVSGALTVKNAAGLSSFFAVAENGDTLKSSTAGISPIGAGSYTVFYTDQNGCQSEDTILMVGLVNDVVAAFSVNPQQGGAPLTVEVVNSSQNAVSYEWSSVPPHPQIGNSTIVFDTAGVWEIILVASGFDYAQPDTSTQAYCTDTARLTVIVYDSLIVEIPNVFTPNGDGINEFFTVTTNIPVQTELVVVNRWGTVVYNFSEVLNKGINNLWDGTAQNGEKVAEGVYFYTLRFALDKELFQCGECVVEKAGYVTVE
jgi:gliding motility-associated-like protein